MAETVYGELLLIPENSTSSAFTDSNIIVGVDETTQIPIFIAPDVVDNNFGYVPSDIPEQQITSPSVILNMTTATSQKDIDGNFQLINIHIEWTPNEADYYQVFWIENSRDGLSGDSFKLQDYVSNYTNGPLFTNNSGPITDSFFNIAFDIRQGIGRLNAFIFAYKNKRKSIFPEVMCTFVGTRITPVNMIFLEKTTIWGGYNYIKIGDGLEYINGAPDNNIDSKEITILE